MRLRRKLCLLIQFCSKRHLVFSKKQTKSLLKSKTEWRLRIKISENQKSEWRLQYKFPREGELGYYLT